MKVEINSNNFSIKEDFRAYITDKCYIKFSKIFNEDFECSIFFTLISKKKSFIKCKIMIKNVKKNGTFINVEEIGTDTKVVFEKALRKSLKLANRFKSKVNDLLYICDESEEDSIVNKDAFVESVESIKALPDRHDKRMEFLINNIEKADIMTQDDAFQKFLLLSKKALCFKNSELNCLSFIYKCAYDKKIKCVNFIVDIN